MKTLDNKYEIIVKDINIPMRDRVVLKATLLIKNDQSSHYTLLQRTPYPRETSISLINAIKLARKGWAVVIQSVRGREGSGGTFQPFIQEVNDGIDTINWIVKQFWSNGKVAMSGASYVGFTQWCCAYSSSKALKAISPQITSTDILNEWFYENGAFKNSFAQSWALSFAHTNPLNKNQKNKAKYCAKNLEKIYGIQKQKSPVCKLFTPYCDWIDKDNSIFWNKIPKLKPDNIPLINTFHLTGWFDIFCEGALSDFAIISNKSDNSESVHRLIIGPWCHNTLLNNKVGEINFGYEADGFTSGIMDEIHDWLLDSIKDNPVKGGAKVFVMGENKWDEYVSWPPKCWKRVKLWLNQEETFQSLTFNFPFSEFFSKIDCTTKNIPISKGGRILDPLSSAGPFNQTCFLQKSAGETLFKSNKLKNNLKVVGKINVQIFVNPENRLNDISLSLLDIHPDECSYNILTTTHRLSLTPKQINKLDLNIGSTAFMFKSGHSIALRVSSSNFPHLDIIYNSIKNNNIKILYGGKYNSYIDLPLFQC